MRAFDEAFVGLLVAGDELPQELPGGVAILADEDEAAVGEHGKHDDRTGVDDDFAHGLDAAGLDDSVASQGEDAALEQDFAANEFCAARLLPVFFADVGLHACSLGMFGVECCRAILPQARAALDFLYTSARWGLMAMNTVIIDDERPAREELIYLLKGFPEVNVVALGKNGLEAVALIKEHDPDLVFLDVEMPGLDGFGVIKKLVERKMRVPQIVFATAYDQYAVQAFEVSAVDYVLKPFDRARVGKAIQRAKKMMDANASPVDRLETLVGQLGAGAAAAAKAQVASAPPVKLLVKSQARMILI